MRSRNGLPLCQSAAIHSLSLKMEGAVVGLMKAGAPQVRAPPPLKVPLLTATVFGGLVRLKPSPAWKTLPWLSNATAGSPPDSYWPPTKYSTPGINVPIWLGSVVGVYVEFGLLLQHQLEPPSLE